MNINAYKPAYRPIVPQKTLKGVKILVDPGHGGSDPGAVGQNDGRESDANLGMSLKLRDRLKELGADVRMTRDTDRNVSRPGGKQSEELRARVRIANSWPADLFVSVHSNASENRNIGGTMTFHARQASAKSKDMAKEIHKEMVAQTGLRDLKVRKAGFYVLRNTNMPAVLVESAFISNAKEEKLLADPKFQGIVASAIADGLSNSAKKKNRPGKRIK